MGTWVILLNLLYSQQVGCKAWSSLALIVKVAKLMVWGPSFLLARCSLLILICVPYRIKCWCSSPHVSSRLNPPDMELRMLKSWWSYSFSWRISFLFPVPEIRYMFHIPETTVPGGPWSSIPAAHIHGSGATAAWAGLFTCSSDSSAGQDFFVDGWDV
jgi:hypothetical protein